MTRILPLALLASLASLGLACRAAGPPAELARHVVVITIDTLRADAVGAYGSATARTPALDGLARDGARFERAWATAPITLPSHASLFSGTYPPAHGARHNGMAVGAGVPTLASAFDAAGFDTGAFVSAFPLDSRFGLARGFDVYDDELPRTAEGRPLNERPGAETVNRAIAWLGARGDARVFLWVHLFEPHAPYGTPGVDGSTAQARYAEEVAVADHEVGRLLAALGDRAAHTLVVATADHGEAFGEHEEIGHSIFVYDTTLRVPLIIRGPGIPRGARMVEDVSLVDVAATISALSGLEAGITGEGLSLVPALMGNGLAPRPLYAESFAPLFDFGWAGLRAVREGEWKYIAAPRPELFDLVRDPAELTNLAGDRPADAARFDRVADAWSGAEPGASASPLPEVAARLGSLGYVSSRGPAPAGARPDPKDRIAVASQMAMVTSGEVQGEARIAALEAILRADPGNPQAHLRLGYAELERERCAAAIPHLEAAVKAQVPSADAGLGLAECYGRAGDLHGAEQALHEALRAEPGNPVAAANLGLLALEQGRPAEAVPRLREALATEPRLLPARFALARALARLGDRAGALAEARALLDGLPLDAPQRAEVERLVTALR